MKRLLVIILLLSVALPLAARHYPFIRGDKNYLQYPAGKSPDYALFLRKLDTLLATGGTDVRVLHVGGSHVQAGTMSDRLRRRFLSLKYGMDGGRGLVFPFAAASTNTPVSYNSSYSGRWESANCLRPADVELGLSGITITAVDTSAKVNLDLIPREFHLMHQRYSFNRVDVLGEGELEPVIILQGRDTIRGVHGGRHHHFDLPYYADWLQLAFKGDGQFQLRGLYLDRPNLGFSLCEAGINGASTTSWTRCSLWEEDLRRLHPDLVIFSIGINDIQGNFDPSRFKSNYRELIRKIRKVNPRCAILFSGINDSQLRRHGVNPYTQAVEKAFFELAKEFKAVFWDWYEVMGGYGSMASWQEAGLAQSDKIHFTSSGYEMLGDLLFDAIINSYYVRQ